MEQEEDTEKEDGAKSVVGGAAVKPKRGVLKHARVHLRSANEELTAFQIETAYELVSVVTFQQ